VLYMDMISTNYVKCFVKSLEKITGKANVKIILRNSG